MVSSARVSRKEATSPMLEEEDLILPSLICHFDENSPMIRDLKKGK